MDMGWLNYTFAIVMLVLGVILIIMAFQASANYDSTGCTNKSIRNCTMWVAMIAAVLIVVPLFYLYIRKRAPEIESFGSISIYAAFCGLLGITLIVLGGVMSSSSAKDPCKPVKSQATTIWIMGLILFVCAAFYGGVEVYKLYNSGQLRSVFGM